MDYNTMLLVMIVGLLVIEFIYSHIIASSSKIKKVYKELIELKNEEIKDLKRQRDKYRNRLAQMNVITVDKSADEDRIADELIDRLPPAFRSIARAAKPKLLEYLKSDEGKAMVQELIKRYSSQDQQQQTLEYL